MYGVWCDVVSWTLV